MKLLNELCVRDSPPKSGGTPSETIRPSNSGEIFPPDYLDKYLANESDAGRSTWVRCTAEDEIRLLVKNAVRRQVCLCFRFFLYTSVTLFKFV